MIVTCYMGVGEYVVAVRHAHELVEFFFGETSAVRHRRCVITELVEIFFGEDRSHRGRDVFVVAGVDAFLILADACPVQRGVSGAGWGEKEVGEERAVPSGAFGVVCRG